MITDRASFRGCRDPGDPVVGSNGERRIGRAGSDPPIAFRALEVLLAYRSIDRRALGLGHLGIPMDRDQYAGENGDSREV